MLAHIDYTPTMFNSLFKQPEPGARASGPLWVFDEQQRDYNLYTGLPPNQTGPTPDRRPC